MYSKLTQSFLFFKQPRVITVIRIGAMICAVMILLNELEQARSSTWYFACLYCFFLIPSIYLSSNYQHQFFTQMSEFIAPLKYYTSAMAAICLGIYIHQVISFDLTIFPAFPH
ncbi:hypothetical protein MSG37_12570 [Shewanella sp. 1CM18E]|uniref:hypothetical protein n=1 Tax=Shewanella sp. 1CM18E TaxID=2929169 RepID=UPI0020C08D4B|nr:hypothetical protein [Shewanella sp. 1CM18E]MCK8045718.1 hypothetical protein [Shewanella sp. 1CM18E]